MATTPKAVKLYNGSFIVSDDDFKTFKKVEILDDYVPLKSSNKSTEVILRCEYGDRKAKVLIDEFKAINILLNQPKQQDDGYGHAFEVFAIATHYGFTYEQVMKNNIICGGGADGKIDAVVIHEEVAYIYQIKMNSRLNDHDLDIAKANYVEFFSSGKISSKDTSDLFSFLQTHKSELETLPKRFCSISVDKTGGNNISSKEIFEKFFANKFLPQQKNNLKLKIPIKPQYDREMNRNVDNIVRTQYTTFLFVNAKDLIDNLFEQGIQGADDKLYYENVRGTLGENFGMQNTIQFEPEKFELYNNGVSVLGKSQIESAFLVVDNPLIINGQQTLHNLMLAKEKGRDLTKVLVPVFIKNSLDGTENLNIAKFNNTQKQIRNIDLLSVNADLRNIQKLLLEQANKNNFEGECFYLQITSNGKRQSDKIIKYLFSKNQIITMKDFVRMYWIIENGRYLGKWKNNINKMIEQEITETYTFSLEPALCTCKIIKAYHDFLDLQAEKQSYKIADVTFMYLLHLYDIKTAQKIIDYINKEICKNDGKTASNFYKSKNIMSAINKARSELNIK